MNIEKLYEDLKIESTDYGSMYSGEKPQIHWSKLDPIFIPHCIALAKEYSDYQNAELLKEVTELKEQLQNYKDKELSLEMVIEYEEIDYALSVLLRDEIVHTNPTKDADGSFRKSAIFLNCSDVFAWALAESEEITFRDIMPIYKAYVENPKWGVTEWVCIKRNLKPQRPIQEDMKKDGAWSDKLNTLQENN